MKIIRDLLQVSQVGNNFDWLFSHDPPCGRPGAARRATTLPTRSPWVPRRDSLGEPTPFVGKRCSERRQQGKQIIFKVPVPVGCIWSSGCCAASTCHGSGSNWISVWCSPGPLSHHHHPRRWALGSGTTTHEALLITFERALNSGSVFWG